MKVTIFLRTFIIMLIQLNAILCYSQSNQIIIGKTDSMYYKNVDITLWDGGSIKDYWLDINNDSVYDFHFVTNVWGSGASGMQEYTNITTFDSTYISTIQITDSACFSTVDVYENYNYILVNKLNLNDTLNNNYVFKDSSIYLAYIRNNWNWPSCTIDSRDFWINQGYKYIGFKKNINNISYWGWIQVSVVSYGQINIKDFAFSFLINESVNQNHIQPIYLYPNPVKDFLYLNGANIDAFSITNGIGQVIIESKLNISNESFMINVDFLNPGIYQFKANSERGTIVMKFIKTTTNYR